MLEDLDIYRSANLMIRQHGDDATIEAAKKADAMATKGDREGARTWLRVLQAIDQLQAKEQPDGAAVN